ncbi:CRISPR-associated helicase Cas3' [Treponema sp. Marseille-Q4132]|uniref:CRISPR-associated helicase Cas3' n=1 Tax=Treponema sp. Marseille-Q4132 TaxID=2766701 RepID=UPI001652CF67|nr:CRISPR-associated helicase Cas3' [Treponema sp. Marseille-Q4132]QNL96288.1 CRISPR-associated helicase Cas3' [Treponema sp. Marseille-Q4132]
MNLWARYRESDGGYQKLSDHLRQTAELSKSFGKKIHLEYITQLAGLLHDLGKASPAWQLYLQNSVREKKQHKKDHATAGAQYLLHRLSNEVGLAETAIQAAVMFHHGSGLPDMLGLDGRSEFLERLNKTTDDTGLDQAKAGLPQEVERDIAECISKFDLHDGGKNQLALPCKAGCMNVDRQIDRKKFFFNMGLHLRNLSSCLIDADRTNSAAFEENKAMLLDDCNAIPDWGVLLQKLERELKKFSNTDVLGKIRKTVSDRCAELGAGEKRIYTCSAFTGAGKTLASLRFALVQAQKYGADRIFIVAPYTSILDQNADKIRSILEDERTRGSIVLECHSNISAEKKRDLKESEDEYDKAEQTWTAPVVITTMVQFLETLFGSGTKKIRRMHRLANSVLVFDEVQTLPLKATYLFNWGLEYLVKCCGCSALLCTATQPCLDKIGENRYRLHIDDEVIPNMFEHFDMLKRVKFIDKTAGGTKKHGAGDIASYIQNEMKTHNSFLAVVNTKPQAKELFELINKSGCADYVYYLSTNMCPAHRKDIIKTVTDDLPLQKRIVCVSTRLIEAGVDVSFEGALRYLAGLDSVIQTAGRCNRNNELHDACGNAVCGKLALFALEGEKLHSLEELKIGQKCMERVLREYDSVECNSREYEASEKNDDAKNLIQPQIIERYFKYYYASFTDDVLQYNIRGKDSTVLDMLSDNPSAVNEYKRTHNGKKWQLPYMQAFRTAWDNFEVIADATTGIIVPYKDGERLINSLSALEKSDNDYYASLKSLLNECQQYTVNMYTNRIQYLGSKGMIYEIIPESGIYALHASFYSNDFGITEEITSDNLSPLHY